MKFEVKKVFMVLPLVAALAACGGGGGDDAGTAVNTNQGTGGATNGGGATGGTTTGGTDGATSAVGKVEEPFLKITTLRYLMVGASLQTSGTVTAWEQLPAGGVVTINGNTLTGADRSVVNIAGDETWGQGRWAKGTAVAGGGSSVLGTARNDAYHYVVYNAPTALPASGQLSCDGGQFTAPNVLNAASGDAFGTATGTAALSFNNGVASVDVSIATTAGSRKPTVSTTGTSIKLDSTTITGAFFAQGDGLMLTLGDAGNGKFRIVAAYQASASGASYRGVASFLCKR